LHGASSGAKYLVSRDNDLLDLMQDETFRQRFPGLVILDPVTLLGELASQIPQPEQGALPSP